MGCVNNLSSIDTNDIVGGTYNNGDTIVITEEDYAVHVYSAELVKQTEQAQVLSMAKDPEKQEYVLEVEQQQQQENIYNEVDIYSEN